MCDKNIHRCVNIVDDADAETEGGDLAAAAGADAAAAGKARVDRAAAGATARGTAAPGSAAGVGSERSGDDLDRRGRPRFGSGTDSAGRGVAGGGGGTGGGFDLGDLQRKSLAGRKSTADKADGPKKKKKKGVVMISAKFCSASFVVTRVSARHSEGPLWYRVMGGATVLKKKILTPTFWPVGGTKYCLDS